jgi:phosphoglycolate phosphatase
MNYRLAIFDFDGTLADSFELFVSLTNLAADRYGFERMQSDELEQLRDLPPADLLKRLRVSRWKLPFIARYIRKLNAEQTHRVALFEGVDALLPYLCSQGVDLAIVSSNAESNIRKTLGPTLSGEIGRYSCGASLFGKAAKLRKVVQQSGMPPEHAIYVGDEVRDADAAKAAGIAFGAVSWGYNRVEALLARRPAEIFASVDDMASKLAGQPLPRSAA